MKSLLLGDSDENVQGAALQIRTDDFLVGIGDGAVQREAASKKAVD